MDKEKSNELEKETEVEKTESKKELKKENKLKEENAKLKADLENWKNEYYKAYADMANLRKSIEKDQQNIYKYRIEGFAQNLLGILDAFDFAFKVDPKTEEMKNYLTGFKYVYSQLIEVLKGEGIEEIVPNVGDNFDSSTMNAVDIKEVSLKEKENKVAQVNLKGYKLHDHLVRAAMVVVTKHPEEKKDEEDKNKKDNKVC